MTRAPGETATAVLAVRPDPRRGGRHRAGRRAPWARPWLDDRAREGARRLGLPEGATELAGLVDGDDLARFAAALVRVSRLPRTRDPLNDRQLLW